MQTDYDDEVAFHAVRHIHDLARAADERPFLLVVSFTNPHDPWEIPPRYWDLYDPSAIEPPAVGEIAQDPHSRRLREMCGADEVELPEEQVLRARHAYYAAISYVDERIGMVLHALRETGLDESTVVAFTADHGEMLGERGLWYKMSLFDGSARVPLIFRGPGVVAESVVSSPASLLDLAPTLLELAGAASTGADLDGRSLVPALTGERDASLVPALAGEGDASLAPVICEYHAEGVNHPAAMVRSGAHKLIVCPGDPDQLYDLEADPHELANLSGRPEVGDVEAQLHSELSARLDLADIEARVLASQRDRRLVADALGRGTATSWDYRPEAPMRYVRSRADLYELQRRARLETRTEPEQQPA
jgi:choline-sulfatase